MRAYDTYVLCVSTAASLTAQDASSARRRRRRCRGRVGTAICHTGLFLPIAPPPNHRLRCRCRFVPSLRRRGCCRRHRCGRGRRRRHGLYCLDLKLPDAVPRRDKLPAFVVPSDHGVYEVCQVQDASPEVIELSPRLLDAYQVGR